MLLVNWENVEGIVRVVSADCYFQVVVPIMRTYNRNKKVFSLLFLIRSTIIGIRKYGE